MTEDEKEQTKKAMKATEEEGMIACNAELNGQTVEQYKAGMEEAIRQLNTPALTTKENFAYQVGNWTQNSVPPLKTVLKEDSLDLPTDEELIADFAYDAYLVAKKIDNDKINSTKIQNMPQNPAHTLSREQIKTEMVDAYKDGMLGYYAKGTAEITLKFKKEPTYFGDLNQNDFGTWYPTYMHEKTHFDHWYYDGMGLAEQTGTNAGKADRLTETTACAVEYLCLAQQYTAMKQAGIETYNVDGKTMPLEHMLDGYPILKETVLQHGFDASSPQSVRRITKIASEYWHERRKDSYSKQSAHMIQLGEGAFNRKSWSEKLDALKNEESTYRAISARMLKNVDIGQNTTVDLSHCRDLLDTLTTEEVRSKLTTPLTYQELKQIDIYLSKKGLKTDSEKTDYMTKALRATAQRDNTHRDVELEKILLQYNAHIIYADDLEIKPTTRKDLRRICTLDGMEYVIPATAQNTPIQIPEKTTENTTTYTRTLNFPQKDRTR